MEVFFLLPVGEGLYHAIWSYLLSFEMLKCVFASVDSENNGLILLLEYIF